jgi:hypothetical protein
LLPPELPTVTGTLTWYLTPTQVQICLCGCHFDLGSSERPQEGMDSCDGLTHHSILCFQHRPDTPRNIYWQLFVDWRGNKQLVNWDLQHWFMCSISQQTFLDNPLWRSERSRSERNLRVRWGGTLRIVSTYCDHWGGDKAVAVSGKDPLIQNHDSYTNQTHPELSFKS